MANWTPAPGAVGRNPAQSRHHRRGNPSSHPNPPSAQLRPSRQEMFCRVQQLELQKSWRRSADQPNNPAKGWIRLAGNGCLQRKGLFHAEASGSSLSPQVLQCRRCSESKLSRRGGILWPGEACVL